METAITAGILQAVGILGICIGIAILVGTLLWHGGAFVFEAIFETSEFWSGRWGISERETLRTESALPPL